MSGHWDDTRTVLSITGSDATKFLQDLVTNDVEPAKTDLVYAALLTPQGKFLFDFFVSLATGGYHLDAAADRVDALITRLTMYRLRADVEISKTDLVVNRGLGQAPEGAFSDPRHPSLGWRSYDTTRQSGDAPNWDAIRVEHMIPASGKELQPDETFILEASFDAIKGVDFKKGCYVGQEVTARMKHKTELRKGFAQVELDGDVAFGTEITSNGKAVGWVGTQSGSKAIAYLRFDRATGHMEANGVAVRRS